MAHNRQSQILLAIAATALFASWREPLSLSPTTKARLNFALVHQSSAPPQSGPPRFKAVEVRGNIDAGGYSTPATAKTSADIIEAIREIKRGPAATSGLDEHVTAAECDEQQGLFEDAAREYKIAAQLNATEGNLWGRGYELLLAGQYTQALDAFRAGLQRYPESLILLIGSGVALYLDGQRDEALEAFLRASDLNPRDRLPYIFLAKTASAAPPELGDRIRHKLKRWADLRPDSGEALYYHADLASLYASRGEYGNAIAEYVQALRIDPAWTSGHYHLAQAYRKSGNLDLAEKELNEFRRLSQRPTPQAIDAQPGLKVSMAPIRLNCTGSHNHDR